MFGLFSFGVLRRRVSPCLRSLWLWVPVDAAGGMALASSRAASATLAQSLPVSLAKSPVFFPPAILLLKLV